MSAPVNVLAVMARAADHASVDASLIGSRFDGQWAAELSEARAAVVELVEAGRGLKAAMDEPEEGPFDTLTVNAFHAADARFCAALAKFGGAA